MIPITPLCALDLPKDSLPLRRACFLVLAGPSLMFLKQDRFVQFKCYKTAGKPHPWYSSVLVAVLSSPLWIKLRAELLACVAA
jgi:hypothetical protein